MTSNNLRIGFAGTFHTLWGVETETTSLGTWTHFTYHKNLAIDYAKAAAKFFDAGGVDATINDELKGKSRSYKTFVKVEYLDTQFNTGKYRGDIITECTDLNYLKWFLQSESSSWWRDNYLMITICKLDKDYLIVDGDLITVHQQALKKLMVDGNTVFTATSNLQINEEFNFNLRASVRVS